MARKTLSQIIIAEMASKSRHLHDLKSRYSVQMSGSGFVASFDCTISELKTILNQLEQPQ